MNTQKLKINASYVLSRIGIGIRGFFTHTYHMSDGPLETLEARCRTVDQNIEYDTKRVAALKYARTTGLKANSYDIYKTTLQTRLDEVRHPGSKIWADIFAPNRSSQRKKSE